mmetsp:Transcript_14264/g.47651  ORF Transcript_14264/g.47651 Transcript_14264/m.47651 type:complete len:93 (-) Transcript_14264:1823-2101(-)
MFNWSDKFQKKFTWGVCGCLAFHFIFNVEYPTYDDTRPHVYSGIQAWYNQTWKRLNLPTVGPAIDKAAACIPKFSWLDRKDNFPPPEDEDED